MGNYCTHPIEYKCLNFKLNLHILDDQLLEIVIDDILNCQEYEPIYGRWDRPSLIQYRWTPIFSSSNNNHEPDYILINIYYPLNMSAESVIQCFYNEERYKGFIMAVSNELSIKCPANIPVKEICMSCYQRKCDKFRYGLNANAVHITVPYQYCSDCYNNVDNMDKFIFFIKQHYSDCSVKGKGMMQALIKWLKDEEYDFDAIVDDLDCNIGPNGYQPLQSNLYHLLVQYKEQHLFQLLYHSFVDVYNNIKHQRPAPKSKANVYHTNEELLKYEYNNNVKHQQAKPNIPETKPQPVHITRMTSEHKTDEELFKYEYNNNVQKVSFQFQLLLHEAVMKHMNPSLKIRLPELELIEEEILSLHHQRLGNKQLSILPDSFRLNKCSCDQPRRQQQKYKPWHKQLIKCCCQLFRNERVALITCYCNQLKREHKERNLKIYWSQDVNLQVHYFNFKDDPEIMNRIAKLVNNDIVSPYEWIEDRKLKDLKTSHFDAKDIMKRLMMKKHPNLKQKYPKKLKLEELVMDDQGKFIKKNGEYKYGKWGKAIQRVIKADCDSGFRQKRCKSNADDTEEIIFELLDVNGYSYKKEIELQKDPDYDNKKGTPDVVFINEPLEITINGKKMKIHWIDVKNFCFWITTKMRYKFWQQKDKYTKAYGTGMFILRLGYVENINVGDDVATVSLTWFKKNIVNIGNNEIKREEEQMSIIETKENDKWLYDDDDEQDERCIDYTKLLPAAYRDEYGAMYPMKEKAIRIKRDKYENY